MANITIPMSLIDTDENIQKLAVSAILKGARPTYQGSDVLYPIEDEYLDADAANYCNSVGGSVDDYSITRYKAVSSLSAKLPASLPGSTVEDDEGNVTAITWQKVQNLSTVNVSPIDGVYYMNVTAHLSHRGLTLDEYNTASSAGVTLLKQSDLPIREDEIE
jgi:hypothetical protein